MSGPPVLPADSTTSATLLPRGAAVIEWGGVSDADEIIDAFLSGGWTPVRGRPVPAAVLEGYAGRAPDILLALWRRFGWAGFDRGRLWLTDPVEWAGVLGEWLDRVRLPVEDTFHVFARDAFGEMDAWGERSGTVLHVAAPFGEIFVHGHSDMMQAGEGSLVLSSWFGSLEQEDYDITDDDGFSVFERALAARGPLAHDQVYGFAPPLVWGGTTDVDRIHVMHAIVQVSLLAQMTPEVRVTTFGP